MSDILKELSDMRRADAEGRERTIPMSEMMRRAEAAPSPRDFAAVFRRDGVNVIAELKRASPSEGMIREDFHPSALAMELEASGAGALSVLCEPHRFFGHEDYLSAARGVTSLPVLYKDFVTTRYQVAAARAAGADAVLLIAAVLDDAALADLLGFAHEVGLRALVETNQPDAGGDSAEISELIHPNLNDDALRKQLEQLQNTQVETKRRRWKKGGQGNERKSKKIRKI